MNKSLALLLSLLLLNGCSAFRSYKDEQKPILESLESEKANEALATLETTAPKEKDLLYYMEKGELLRLNKNYKESLTCWTQADSMIHQWENEEKINLQKVGDNIGSVLLNDRIRNYDGEDYEKVLLSTRQALNYFALGNLEDANVEMKKTWERESLIKSLHEKEMQQAEEKAKKEGYSINASDLNGYPVATLNSAEVISLKNGYQSAFSQYLSGFLAEASGDIGNAAAGYREAIELQPSLVSIRQHLAGLDQRINQQNAPIDANLEKGKKSKNGKLKKETKPEVITEEIDPDSADVLFVVENGFAPTRSGIKIPIPVPQAGLLTAIWPVLETDPRSSIKASAITLPSSQTLKLESITNVEAMAKRSLKDNLPGIMLRQAIRTAAKGAAQAAAYNQNVYAGLAVNAFNFATEQADERIWKSLPQEITIARARLPQGAHSIKIQTNDGIRAININVKDKYCVVPVRIINKATYVLQ